MNAVFTSAAAGLREPGFLGRVGLVDMQTAVHLQASCNREGPVSPALAPIIRLLRERHGLEVSRYDESFLSRSIEKRRQVTACATAEAYLARLAEDGAEAESLWRSLRVCHSDFFRNPLAFAWLEQVILPGLFEARERSAQGEIRIWSAACAAGQEPWSVAILLHELVEARDREGRVSYRIFATDVSEPDLALARAGVYSAAALGNVRRRYLDGPFVRQGDVFAIAPRLRAQVEFSFYDLLDESTTCPSASIYGDFDVVLCSNVLLYYRLEAQRGILAKLWRCLTPGGYLVTGDTERPIVEAAGGFRAVAPCASVFQKTRGAP